MDLKGLRFNRLLVIEKLDMDKGDGRTYWKCLCDCGNLTHANTAYLRSGRKASCGCIRSEKARTSIQKLIGWSKLPAGVAAFNNFYSQYKGGANRKSIRFELTKEQFFDITQKKCFYCNKKPDTPHCKYAADGSPKNNGPYVSNGIDRIDSSKGYVIENIVPCCRTCNTMKNQLSVDDFLNHIRKLHRNVKNIKERLK